MDYLPFAAMVIAIAAGLAGLAAWHVLPARRSDAGMVAAILVTAVLALATDLPGPLHARLFGPNPDGTVPGSGFLTEIFDGFSEGYSGATADQRAEQIKAELQAQSFNWMFDGDADLDSFARQVVAEAGNDASRLNEVIAQLSGERAKARMHLLHQARLEEVTGVITSVIETLDHFIDNGQFGTCRTFLLGGHSLPGTGQEVMIRLANSLGAAVRSGQRGEKDWDELSAADLETYGAKAVTYLLENGYTGEQLQSMDRLDTVDPAEMETNCRFTRDLFTHLVTEYPPEVAASIYIAEL